MLSFKKKKSEEKLEIKKYYKSDALETEEDRLCEKISMISDNRPVILVISILSRNPTQKSRRKSS